ncbi:YaaA family protein, partial [Anaerosporobacter sp.]
MLVFISPAKTMKLNKTVEVKCERPLFEHHNKKVLKVLQELSISNIQTIMKVNEKIATKTYENHNNIQLDDRGSPALYTYDGIQYKSMGTELFTKDDIDYANEHVRILSGLYGILKPNTSIYPYRLEMQLKLPVEESKNLYEFWEKPIIEYLQKSENQHKVYVN